MIRNTGHCDKELEKYLCNHFKITVIRSKKKQLKILDKEE
jgi:hypothetical protein